MGATTVPRNLRQQVIHLTRGYSRDHRPDLNQVMLDLIVEHQAGIPLLMKPLSGNSSDGQAFGQIVTEHIKQLQTTYGTTYLVADSALYSAENLQKLAKTGSKWITRVPATVTEAQDALAHADPDTMEPLVEGYRYHMLASTYGGVAQRWMLCYSAHRRPQAQRSVDKHWLQAERGRSQGLSAALPHGLCLCRRCPARPHDLCARVAGRLPARGHHPSEAALWQAGPPAPQTPRLPRWCTISPAL